MPIDIKPADALATYEQLYKQRSPRLMLMILQLKLKLPACTNEQSMTSAGHHVLMNHEPLLPQMITENTPARALLLRVTLIKMSRHAREIVRLLTGTGGWRWRAYVVVGLQCGGQRNLLIIA